MEGIINQYLFLICFSVVFFLVVRRELLVRKRDRFYNYFKLFSMLYVFFVYFFLFRVDYKEYKSFDKLNESEIIKITWNNVAIKEDIKIPFFKDLKKETFSVINHPEVISKDTVCVFTTNRIFKFVIKNTSNQGVVVIRLNSDGKDYVTTKNNNLSKYLKSNSK